MYELVSGLVSCSQFIDPRGNLSTSDGNVLMNGIIVFSDGKATV